MSETDIVLSVAGSTAQGGSMIDGKGTISLSLQTAISASSQSQVGATIVKGVVAAG